MTSILSLLGELNGAQRAAVEDVASDMVLTAGAGSGKTRALVGRYLSLLDSGLPPRAVVAITFTDKAAREMRSRIRELVERWLAALERASGEAAGGSDLAGGATGSSGAEARDRASGEADPGAAGRPEARVADPGAVERQRWQAIYTELDAAPIGTIHSLCARLLRAHPAEAGVDPAFEVLDEGHAATLRAEAVEDSLVWAASDLRAADLFGMLDEDGLRRAVAQLLERRLDARRAFEVAGPDPLARWRAALMARIGTYLDDPAVRRAAGLLMDLRSGGQLAVRADDTLAQAIVDCLAAWDTVSAAHAAGDVAAALQALPAARRAMRPDRGRKGAWPDIEFPRGALADLRAAYQHRLGDLLKHPVDWSLEARAAAAVPVLRTVVERAGAVYSRAKARRRALDFDDLEVGALDLLAGNPAVRVEWQARVRAVLVDEFQDTNDRQRRIVFHLAGHPAAEVGDCGRQRPGQGEQEPATALGGLFVVGDAKQSIYRFRGADVTVFRRVQTEIGAAGGRAETMDVTFRAHGELVRQLNATLAAVMALEPSDDRPYAVPFAPLAAHRQSPADGVRPPYVELCLGLGEDVDEGRAAAARATAARLRELHDQEGIAWSGMGLLFRAASGFPAYEDALAAAAIPYITVAGRGFYDRPEVRDVVNALRAIADPTDDAALVGLLRSPAFGLSDAAIYLLRRDATGAARSVWTALTGDLKRLDSLGGAPESIEVAPDSLGGASHPGGSADRARAERARATIAALHELAGRVTVAGLAKRFLDETGYHAILRAAARPGPGGAEAGTERARRNVDKLLADAQASRMVSVGAFLEYRQALRDVAAREGEAPAEAGEAVQLMTVHKAKGLEFPLVVIADAGRRSGGGATKVILDDALGPLLDVRPEPVGAGPVDRSGDPLALEDSAPARAAHRPLGAQQPPTPGTAPPGGPARSAPAASADARSIAHRLGVLGEADQDDAEERRLLYVAATRASEKLLVSGHVKLSRKKDDPGRLLLQGWLARLAPVVGLDDLRLPDLPTPSLAATAAGEESATALRVAAGEPETFTRPAAAAGEAFPPPLVAPVVELPPAEADETLAAREARPPRRVWRVVPTAEDPRGPAWVTGTLVHQALRAWRFPGDEGFEALLRLHALEAGLTDAGELEAASRHAARLLERFRSHPLFAELAALDGAARWHEVPYSILSAPERGGSASGVIDLLYRRADRWHVVDFKTDRIADEEQLRAKVEDHGRQIRLYAAAVRALLGEVPLAALCFLDAIGQVRVEWTE